MELKVVQFSSIPLKWECYWYRCWLSVFSQLSDQNTMSPFIWYWTETYTPKLLMVVFLLGGCLPWPLSQVTLSSALLPMHDCSLSSLPSNLQGHAGICAIMILLTGFLQALKQAHPYILLRHLRYGKPTWQELQVDSFALPLKFFSFNKTFKLLSLMAFQDVTANTSVRNQLSLQMQHESTCLKELWALPPVLILPAWVQPAVVAISNYLFTLCEHRRWGYRQWQPNRPCSPAILATASNSSSHTAEKNTVNLFWLPISMSDQKKITPSPSHLGGQEECWVGVTAQLPLPSCPADSSVQVCPSIHWFGIYGFS